MKYSLIKLSIFMLLITSCSDDIEDFNKNPNEPEVVPAYTVFNNATAEYTTAIRNEFSAGRLTLPWVQYWGQTSYADEDRFLYRETTANGIYRDSYRVGTDLRKVIELNTDEATRNAQAAFGDNENQIAAARIMLAFMFHHLTDTFGDVPYYSFGTEDPSFQALQPSEFLSPVFAEQEKIYEDLIKELKAASDQLVTSEPVFTIGDNIFDGDASKWKKFANSLILRIANRQRNVDPAAANAAIDEAVAAGVMTSNADNAVQKYSEEDATASPFWQAYIDRTDFGVTNTFVRALKGENNSFDLDPRLFKMAAPSDASIDAVLANTVDESNDEADFQGIPYAFPLAQQLPFSSFTFPSSNVLKPDYGEVLMEYAEVQFILSERNGFSQAEYEEGVRASMQKWDVAQSDIDAFVDNLPPASQETVMNQKYVALYMQSDEAWAEYRRTGFPEFLVLPDESIQIDQIQLDALPDDTDASYVFIPRVDIPEMPKRLRYPQSLQTLNGENRSNAVDQLDNADTVTSPLFWDVN